MRQSEHEDALRMATVRTDASHEAQIYAELDELESDLAARIQEARERFEATFATDGEDDDPLS